MSFPPKHPTPLTLLTIQITALHSLTIRFKNQKVKKMNRRDELFWADRERIRRAEEMRRKNEKREVKK